MNMIGISRMSLRFRQVFETASHERMVSQLPSRQSANRATYLRYVTDRYARSSSIRPVTVCQAMSASRTARTSWTRMMSVD